MVLKHISGAVEQTVDATAGLGRVATAPLASNRTTSGTASRFVKREVGTVLDLVPVTLGTAVLYTLLSERNDEPTPLAFGKGVGYGVMLFIGSYTLRKVVM